MIIIPRWCFLKISAEFGLEVGKRRAMSSKGGHTAADTLNEENPDDRDDDDDEGVDIEEN